MADRPRQQRIPMGDVIEPAQQILVGPSPRQRVDGRHGGGPARRMPPRDDVDEQRRRGPVVKQRAHRIPVHQLTLGAELAAQADQPAGRGQGLRRVPARHGLRVEQTLQLLDRILRPRGAVAHVEDVAAAPGQEPRALDVREGLLQSAAGDDGLVRARLGATRAMLARAPPRQHMPAIAGAHGMRHLDAVDRERLEHLRRPRGAGGIRHRRNHRVAVDPAVVPRRAGGLGRARHPERLGHVGRGQARHRESPSGAKRNSRNDIAAES